MSWAMMPGSIPIGWELLTWVDVLLDVRAESQRKGTAPPGLLVGQHSNDPRADDDSPWCAHDKLGAHAAHAQERALAVLDIVLVELGRCNLLPPQDRLTKARHGSLVLRPLPYLWAVHPLCLTANLL